MQRAPLERGPFFAATQVRLGGSYAPLFLSEIKGKNAPPSRRWRMSEFLILAIATFVVSTLGLLIYLLLETVRVALASDKGEE
jgi:hypothetical protein